MQLIRILAFSEEVYRKEDTNFSCYIAPSDSITECSSQCFILHGQIWHWIANRERMEDMINKGGTPPPSFCNCTCQPVDFPTAVPFVPRQHRASQPPIHQPNCSQYLLKDSLQQKANKECKSERTCFKHVHFCVVVRMERNAGLHLDTVLR